MIMKMLFLFILVFALLMINVSADNVTIEVWENSHGEYYISYHDDLIACDGDECTFNVDNYSHNYTDFELSNKDITKIAQMISLEIDFTDHIDAGVNESFVIAALGNNRDDITDNLRSHMTNTITPSVEEIDEVTNKLSECEIGASVNASKAGMYNEMRKSKDNIIDIQNGQIKTMEYLCGILTLSFIAVLGLNSTSFKRILELKGRKR